ncbi:MAG: type IV pilus modification protein PilV [Zoogloea sp.]|nr:type IV pilus modification protein PilV [Zoogloea sp.]
MMRPNVHSRRMQSGFSLIEVLVAIVIMAIGLLGVAGLNLIALRGTQDAGNRTVATELAYEIAERMRANPGARASYNSGAAIDTTATPPDCFSNACTGAQQALQDRILWARSINNMSITDTTARALQARLPDGQAAVCIDSTPNDGTPATPACDNAANAPFVVKLWWNERSMNQTEANGGATVQRFFATSFVP